MSIDPTVEWGTFYSGTRQQIATKVALRVRPGVIVYLAHEWNRIDLPEGRLRTQVFEATPELQFSQWISLVNTVQFDTVSSVLGWQSRFRWILKPGNDLFFVYRTTGWRISAWTASRPSAGKRRRRCSIRSGSDRHSSYRAVSRSCSIKKLRAIAESFLALVQDGFA